MSTKANSTELEIARRALTAARENMVEHIGSPNLTGSGRPKTLVAPTPQARPASAAALKREYGNGREKSVQQVEREVVGDSIMLRGKVRAAATAQHNVAQRTQALKLSPNLAVPIADHLRATNKDGATSFHFKHEAIAKTVAAKTSASGSTNRKNAGRDHAKYLERDSAVARNAEIADASRPLGQKTEGAISLGRAAEGGLYIEREEALAHHENGVAAIYSNISDDAEERLRFWTLVEERESNPSPDHLIFVAGQDPAFWNSVQTDSRCPERLSLAIREADPSKPCRIRTDDNEYVRQIMIDHGWAPPSPRKPGENAAEKAKRELLDQANSKGAHCQDGRGGRIQDRIVGELPYEVSYEQRDRIVRRVAAHFDGQNLPYVAVMHAPDHANNEKNWHFHLAYYTRPCGRFTGISEDYLEEPKDNPRAKAMYEVKAKALASGALLAYVGKEWDFAVPVEYTTNCGHKRVTHPFAQDKNRECTKRDYLIELRKMLAEFTNDELELAGSDRRVDPRKFDKMGINKEAEEHLGSRSAQMEFLGIATPRGVENEHRQWQFKLNAFEEKTKADNRDAAIQERLWRQSLEARELNASDHSDIIKMIVRWAQAQAEANEQAAIASELKLMVERAKSRAKKVQETCTSHLAAIAAGRANKRQRDNKINYETRLTEATHHLMGVTVVMASDILQEKRSRTEAVRLAEEADKLGAAINARLKEELVAIMAAPVLIKGTVKARAGSRTQTLPVAESHSGKEAVNPAPVNDQSGGPLRQTDPAALEPSNHNSETDPRAPWASRVLSTAREPGADIPAGDKTNALTTVMRQIDEVAAAVIPIIRQKKDGRHFYRLANPDIRGRTLIVQNLQLVPVQLRLRGIYEQQERDINRLLGFIRLNPSRATIVNGPPASDKRQIVGLSQSAPPDLQILAQKYANHFFAQRRMGDAVRQALQSVGGASQVRPMSAGAGTVESAPNYIISAASNVDWQNTLPPVPNAIRPDTAPIAAISRIEPSEVENKGRGQEPLPDDASNAEVAAGTDEAPALDQGQEPLDEPSGSTTLGAIGSDVSLLKENSLPAAAVNGSDDASQNSGPPASNAVFADKVSGPNRPPANSRVETPAEAVPGDQVGTVPAAQSRTVVRAILSDEEIRDTLRPRLIGPQGTFRPIETPNELDPITVAKLLWAYGADSSDARPGMSREDKDLHSRAVQHRLANELRAALIRGRTLSQRAPIAADPPQEDQRANTHLQAALNSQLEKGGI